MPSIVEIHHAKTLYWMHYLIRCETLKRDSILKMSEEFKHTAKYVPLICLQQQQPKKKKNQKNVATSLTVYVYHQMILKDFK